MHHRHRSPKQNLKLQSPRSPEPPPQNRHPPKSPYIQRRTHSLRRKMQLHQLKPSPQRLTKLEQRACAKNTQRIIPLVFTVRRAIQGRSTGEIKARIDSPHVDGNCLAKVRIANVASKEAKRRRKKGKESARRLCSR